MFLTSFSTQKHKLNKTQCSNIISSALIPNNTVQKDKPRVLVTATTQGSTQKQWSPRVGEERSVRVLRGAGQLTLSYSDHENLKALNMESQPEKIFWLMVL